MTRVLRDSIELDPGLIRLREGLTYSLHSSLGGPIGQLSNELGDVMAYQASSVQLAGRVNRRAGGHKTQQAPIKPSLARPKTDLTVGQPNRTEPVGPTKWAGPVSVQFRSGPHSLFGKRMTSTN